MERGKVIASSLNVRREATAASSRITSLSTGTIVELVRSLQGGAYFTGNESRRDWYEIRISGQTGYVAAAWIQEISTELPPPSSPSIQEIRGVWLLSRFNRPVLTSTENIKQALDFLELKGFNALFVAVWNQGFTAFDSDVMARNGFPRQDPEYVRLGIDPLQEVIKLAKERNFAVFPWFEYGFAASPASDGGHILTTKPKQWSALDRGGNIVQHGSLTWMNSLNPEVQQFITDLMLEVIEKYDIAGVQGCDRLPAMPHLGGYDEATKAQYRDRFGVNPPSNTKDARWVKFRADMLTAYLKSLRDRVKAKDSNCLFSISPSPFPFGLENVLQDADNWVKQDLVDFICPQFYRTSFTGYKREVDRLKGVFSAQQIKKFAPGIAFTANSQELLPRDIVQAVNYNRNNGLGGQVFFFYEGLLNNADAIASALVSEAGFDQVATPFQSA